jgi:two-component system chemotaxis response regulator CheB
MLDIRENVKNDPIRVMIVDDSSAIRGFLMKALGVDKEITVSTTAANGAVALNYVLKYDIEVLILDIEMPEMDGLTALPELLKTMPYLKIIMVSSLTSQNAPLAIKALSLGASDYIEKPTATINDNVEYFNLELINKVKSLGYAARTKKLYQNSESHNNDHNISSISNLSIDTSNILNPSNKLKLPSSKSPIILRKNILTKIPVAIAIACSTGGPQALQKIFATLKSVQNIKSIPIFITQHMPPIFTTYLATHIQKVSGLIASEGVNGEEVVPGKIYIAPGNFHMEVVKNSNYKSCSIIKLTKEPPENYCRPSADPMFRTLGNIYKDRLLAIVLTGIGRDGTGGAKIVVDNGGTVIAQDEATSVIWGMPGAVAQEGLCSAVLPIEKISDFIINLSNNACN